MRKPAFLFAVFSLILSGCSSGTNALFAADMPTETAGAASAPPTASSAARYPDLGAAPELTNQTWLNSDGPLRLADLRGKVVLLEMWTFGCINCRNTLPTLKEWHEEYSADGLVIIGNHYPEFDYESDLENLTQAVADLSIPYPVAQDNNGATWRAYHTRYWPTLFLIDKSGHLRYTRIGEGGFADTEAAIQALLAETY